jgi:hypothetical protein
MQYFLNKKQKLKLFLTKRGMWLLIYCRGDIPTTFPKFQNFGKV